MLSLTLNTLEGEILKLSTGLIEPCRDESVTIVKSQVSFHYLNEFKSIAFNEKLLICQYYIN